MKEYFVCAVHATQTQQTNFPSISNIGPCDNITKVVSHLSLRRYVRQDSKINIILLNCNPELQSGKNFKCKEYVIELVIR
jgi:hypothetical protein